MWKLAFCFSFAILCSGDEITAQEAFNKAQQQVARQLSAVANYTCVLTIDRTLNLERKRQATGCAGSNRASEKPFMHDRLRLDVAVSEGTEIFSWHGGRKFTTAGVHDIVKFGPISSGSFVGYLRNILFTRGVAINFDRGASDAKSYRFNYYVSLKQSAYEVKGHRGDFVVPYHGSFAVRTDTFELESLSVNANEIPRAAEVCSAETDISYQDVQISGKSLLIPSSFHLHLLDPYGVDTWSQSEYTQCREFRGESTIRFDFDDSTQAQSNVTVHDEWLPAGAELHVRLNTVITDGKTFTGDPVEGVLLNSFHVKGLNVTVPKGALLSGIVSRMELRYQPTQHYVVAIRWDRLTFNQNSLLLNANPRRLFPQGRRFGPNYSPGLSADGSDEQSAFVWPSNHFRMDQTFTAYFETAERPSEHDENTR